MFEHPSIQTWWGVALGAIVAISIALFPYLNKRRFNKQGLSGPWISYWEPKSKNKSQWVQEEMMVDHDLLSVKLRNQKNGYGYKYECFGKLIHNTYLVGTWRSVRENDGARGVFLLSVNPNKTFMFGQIVGPNDQGLIRSGKFVLARHERDIAVARDMLE